MTIASEFLIKTGYIPGSIGRIAELHGTYYHRHWGFGLFFEAKVATELSAFLQRFDEEKDGIWLIEHCEHIEGAIVIDGIQAESEGAHLRWFIVSDALRGRGTGRKLLEHAMAFCKSRAFRRSFLWTFEGLDAARHLYEDAGFELVQQKTGDQWGKAVTEQYFQWNRES